MPIRYTLYVVPQTYIYKSRTNLILSVPTIRGKRVDRREVLAIGLRLAFGFGVTAAGKVRAVAGVPVANLMQADIERPQIADADRPVALAGRRAVQTADEHRAVDQASKACRRFCPARLSLAGAIFGRGDALQSDFDLAEQDAVTVAHRRLSGDRRDRLEGGDRRGQQQA